MKRKVLKIVLIVVCMCLFVSACSENQDGVVTGNQEIGVINFYFENGRYFDVLVEADTLSGEALDDPELRFIIAKTYLEIGHPDRAQEILDNLKLEGHDLENIDLLVVEALYKQRKLNKAKDLLLSNKLQGKYSTNPDAMLLRAQIELAGNNIDDAKELLQKLEATFPDHADGQIWLARIDLLENRESKAVERIKKVLDSEKELSEAWLMYANIKFSNEEYLDAENYYLQALKLDNSKILTQQSLKVAQNVVLAKTALGNSVAGEQFYKNFLDSYPKSPIYYFELARLAYSKNDLEDAEENLKEVLKTTKNNPRVIALLAKILVKQDKVGDASLLLEKHIANSIGGIELIALKAITDLMLGQNQTAIDLLIKYSNENDELKAALNPLLAHAYLKNNNHPKYQELMNRSDISNASSVKGINSVRTIYLEVGKYNEAENFISQLVETFPKSNEMKVLYLSTLNDIGTLLHLISINQAISNGSYKSAIKQFKSINSSQLSGKEEALLTNNIKNLVFKTRGQDDQKNVFDLLVRWQNALPENLQLSLILADIYITEGVYKQAVPLYESIVSKHPNDYVILNNLAWSYFSLGDERALEMAEKAYASNPNDAPVCDTLGWILVESGEVERGLQHIQEALEIDPNNADIQKHFEIAKSR